MKRFFTIHSLFRNILCLNLPIKLSIFKNLFAEKFHSENGPLLASKLPFTTTFGSALLQAAESLGFRVGDVNGKYNSGQSENFTFFQFF